VAYYSGEAWGHALMKNCEPFVLGPAFAMESMPGLSCFKLAMKLIGRIYSRAADAFTGLDPHPAP